MEYFVEVLVAVEDSIDGAVLANIVEQEGYRVIRVDTGIAATTSYAERRPQLVLLDVDLSRSDNYQVARQIKALAGETFVPIIFLTESLDADELAQCVDAGGDDFLSKPYNKVVLQAKLNALERQRQLHDTMLQQRDQIARHNAYLMHEQVSAKAVFDRVAHTGSLDNPNIKYLISPLAMFNGDVLLAARNPGGGLYVFMGDFTGHGLTAGIGAMPLADVFYGMTQKGFLLEEVIRECNKKLHTILPPGQFCCATMVDVNYHKRSIEYWSGGLPKGYVVRAQPRCLDCIESVYLPLGILEPTAFRSETKTLELVPGDRLLMYTDGLLESRDSSGRVFTEMELEKTLIDAPNLDQLFDAIQLAAYDQIGAQERDDDVTLIEITMLEEVDAVTKLPEYISSSQSGPQDWELSYRLGPASLRWFNPLPLLQHVLMEVPELCEHGAAIYVVLAETFSNALEHGVLGLNSITKSTPKGFAEYYAQRASALELLESGYVQFDLSCTSSESSGRLSIQVMDTGSGFAHQDRVDNLDDSSYHGRGIRLLHKLCHSVTYTGSGNQVEAVFVWLFPDKQADTQQAA